jgi:hypothetical protein
MSQLLMTGRILLMVFLIPGPVTLAQGAQKRIGLIECVAVCCDKQGSYSEESRLVQPASEDGAEEIINALSNP